MRVFSTAFNALAVAKPLSSVRIAFAQAHHDVGTPIPPRSHSQQLIFTMPGRSLVYILAVMGKRARKTGDQGLVHPTHDGQRGALATRRDQDPSLFRFTGLWPGRVAERSEESAAVRKVLTLGYKI